MRERISTSRILLVDDDPVAAEALGQVLQQAGFNNLVMVEDPRLAVNSCQQQSPDLILLDLHMPHLDGFGLLAELQPWLQGPVPAVVIMLTADASREAKERALQSGVRDFLAKPVDPVESLLRIRNLLEMRVLALELQQRNRELELEVHDRTSDLRASVVRLRQTQSDLETSERHYRLLFEQNSAGAFRCTLDGSLLDYNEALLRIAGRTPRASVPATLQDLGMAQVLEELKTRERVESLECRLPKPEGATATVLINAVRVPGSASYPAAVHGTVVDISALRQLQEELRQAQKMEALGRLAAGVTHDFNNLLTIISGYSDLLLQRHAGDDRSQSHLLEIRKAVDRALGVTRQLLTFSRQQPVTPQILHLNTCVKNLQSRVQRIAGTSVEVLLVLEPTLPAILAEPSGLDQLLLNLVSNAREAMPHGGRLVIETALTNINSASHGVAPGSYVSLAVSDTGVGIAADVLPHIFEPFFTTKKEIRSAGLGLATSYGIVQQCGGFIQVESEPGQGSRFQVLFPLAETRGQAEPGSLAVVAPPRPATETILLVEDEDALRALAARLLETEGYTVLAASNADEALELCERQPVPLHLLLTDLVMPGMNGRELAKAVGQRHPETRTLFMSGYANNIVLHRGGESGGRFFLQKPFTGEVLTRKVREVLDMLPEPVMGARNAGS